MRVKKLIAWAILGSPFAILLVGVLAVHTPNEVGFDDLKDFINNSGADMRGKIEPPPEFEVKELATFGGGGCRPQSIFSSQRLKRQTKMPH